MAFLLVQCINDASKFWVLLPVLLSFSIAVLKIMPLIIVNCISWSKMENLQLIPLLLFPIQTMDGFRKLGFSHCIGALDGCHIPLVPLSFRQRSIEIGGKDNLSTLKSACLAFFKS